jgi:hypothetical protein
LFSTVHVACEQWRVLHCSLGRVALAQTKIAGLGPAHSKKKNSKKFFKKFVILPHISLSILLKFGLYFYTIKIQIQC